MMRPDELEALAAESIEQTDSDFGKYPGYRAAQAKGTLCQGTFAPTPVAAKLTRAVHFRPGPPTPVTVRFSNAATNPMRRDGACDVRGMSVAFHLRDGRQTDIIGLRMPRFFVGTARQFVDWQRAMRRPPWGDLPWPKPIRVAHYLLRRRLPASFGAAQIAGLKRVPSYANCRYNSLHAFRWVDASGRTRHVRYSWVPMAGEKQLHWWQRAGRGPDYLREVLAKSLANGTVRFALEVQIADVGDPVNDASVKWPDSRPRVTVGTLELTAMGPCEVNGDQLRFDPTRVTDGVELPEDDDLLMLRKYVYALSARRRGAHASVNVAAGPGEVAPADPVRKVHVNGVDICYERSKKAGGRPLLLMMGFACPMTWWHKDFRAELEARGFHVIRFDTRDCGKSSRIDVKVGKLRGLLFSRAVAPYDVDDLADDAAGLLGKIGVPAAHVMGISLGGMVGQALAIRHPERVLSLTSINATPWMRKWPPSRWPTLRVMGRLTKPQPTKSEAKWIKYSMPLWRLMNASHFPFEEQHVHGLLEDAWSWSGGANPDGDFRQMVAVLASRDRTAGLQELRMPTLVIHGSDDPMVRIAGGFETWAAVEDAKLTIVNGMGHYTPRQTWKIVIDGVDAIARQPK
jgi:pimeloyl-ACP methyl ester carboxylesterase